MQISLGHPQGLDRYVCSNAAARVFLVGCFTAKVALPDGFGRLAGFGFYVFVERGAIERFSSLARGSTPGVKPK